MPPVSGASTASVRRAEARRSAGTLREAILRLLAAACRPISALELRDCIGGEVPDSLVFREVRKLTDRGQIRKIWAARGYVLADGSPSVALVCRECGETAEILQPDAFAAIEHLAAAHGFTPTRPVVEMIGVCEGCSALSDTKAVNLRRSSSIGHR